MKIRSALLLIPFLCAAMACSPASPKLGPPDETISDVDMNLDRDQNVGSPKVDILFVIDNSLSMTKHQKNLAANIDGFVNAFAKNAAIDFHIGFVPIYDSIKFGKIYEGKTVTKFYPLGNLLGLRDPKNHDGPRLAGTPYITPDTPDYLNKLKATLNEGEEDGPEFEETFSPIVAALSPPVVDGPNQGFYRPDGYLVPILLTDADDSSPGISADGLYDFLYNLKNGDQDKIMPIGVIVPIDAPNCPRDPSGPPYKITRFLTMAQGEILSLCSANFGQKLATIGDEFSQRVGRQIVKLQSVPDPDTLKVTYGTQTIPNDSLKGWSLDVEHSDIIFSGKMELTTEPGAQINIHYTPVNLLNVKNGHTKRMQ